MFNCGQKLFFVRSFFPPHSLLFQMPDASIFSCLSLVSHRVLASTPHESLLLVSCSPGRKTECLPFFVSGHETFRSERCNWRTWFLLSTDSESLGKRCSSDMIERKERMMRERREWWEKGRRMRDGREKKLERKGRMTPTPFSFLLRFIETKLIWWPLLLILVVIPRRQGTKSRCRKMKE